MWFLMSHGDKVIRSAFFFFLLREDFQVRVYGIVRDMKLWVGKQKHSDKKGWFFFSEICQKYCQVFFSWDLLQNFGKKWKRLKSMEIQAAQLIVVLIAEFCVTGIAKSTYRDIMFTFLALSLAMGVSSVAQSYHQGSLHVVFTHHGCLSASLKMNFCFQLANFSLFWWNVSKPRALTCLSVKCYSVSGIRCLVLFKLSYLCLFISRAWNTQQCCLCAN